MGNENISRIRDILLGKNLTELEAKFEQIESYLINEVKAAEKSYKADLSSLENYVKEVLKTIATQLKHEEEERKTEFKKINNDIEDLKKQLKEIKKETTSSAQETHKTVLEKNKEFSVNITKQFTEFKEQYQKKFQLDISNKLDKSTLAVLLSDLAMELSESEAKEEKKDDK